MSVVRSFRIAASAQKKGEGRDGAAAYSLKVPREIARLVPDDTEFLPELTEDGLLYRRVTTLTPFIPSWAERVQEEER